jgi:hypothetical protein
MYPIFIRKGKHKYEIFRLAPKEQPELRKKQMEDLSKLSKKKIIKGTIVGVIDGNTVRFGVAFLSHKDVYNKVIGKKIAYSRAVKLPVRVFNLTAEEGFTLKQTVEQAQNLVEAFANKVIPMQNPTRAKLKKNKD